MNKFTVGQTEISYINRSEIRIIVVCTTLKCVLVFTNIWKSHLRTALGEVQTPIIGGWRGITSDGISFFSIFSSEIDPFSPPKETNSAILPYQSCTFKNNYSFYYNYVTTKRRNIRSWTLNIARSYWFIWVISVGRFWATNPILTEMEWKERSYSDSRIKISIIITIVGLKIISTFY